MQVSQVDSVTTQGAVKPTTSRFNSIDALRGFAAAAVVLYHLWNRFYPHLSTQSRALDLPGGGGLDFLAVVPATIWLRRCDTVLCCERILHPLAAGKKQCTYRHGWFVVAGFCLATVLASIPSLLRQSSILFFGAGDLPVVVGDYAGTNNELGTCVCPERCCHQRPISPADISIFPRF